MSSSFVQAPPRKRFSTHNFLCTHNTQSNSDDEELKQSVDTAFIFGDLPSGDENGCSDEDYIAMDYSHIYHSFDQFFRENIKTTKTYKNEDKFKK